MINSSCFPFHQFHALGVKAACAMRTKRNMRKRAPPLIHMRQQCVPGTPRATRLHRPLQGNRRSQVPNDMAERAAARRRLGTEGSRCCRAAPSMLVGRRGSYCAVESGGQAIMHQLPRTGSCHTNAVVALAFRSACKGSLPSACSASVLPPATWIDSA